MRKAVFFRISLLSLIFSMAPAGHAVLEEVSVGGHLGLRGRTYMNTYTTGRTAELRGPAEWFYGRVLGAPSLTSRFDWDRRGSDSWYAETVTRLHVRARFSGGVSTMLELYNYDLWGEDFRSDYLRGTDAARAGQNDLEFLQAYIEVEDLWEEPLRLRLGRQSMVLGRGWLVGEKSTSTQYISFDAVRLTYAPADRLTVDAWAAKLNETMGPAREDAIFYGVYATWAAAPVWNLSVYYMLVHDGSRVEDTDLDPVSEGRERLLGVDQYGPTRLNTAGARFFGKPGAWDFDLEGAWQWGAAAHLGRRFQGTTLWGVYGDDDAEYGAWAADGEVGRTFDAPWQPRVFLGGAWFDGEDRRDMSFGDWLNPFRRPRASVSFNRLFSQTYYAAVIVDNTHMSNFNQVRAGINFTPAEQWWVQLRAASFRAVDAFEWPAHLSVNGRKVPWLPRLGFWSTPSSRDLGVTFETTVRYHYSQDLTLTLYWGHLFTGDGLGRDGNFVYLNGTEFSGGTKSHDADYVTLLAELQF